MNAAVPRADFEPLPATSAGAAEDIERRSPMNSTAVLIIRLIHLIALSLAVGAATAKNILLFRCRKDSAFVPTYLQVEGPITKQIIAGQVLLTLTGIVYALVLGYAFTPRLIVKVALLASLWVLGPTMDHVLAPKLRRAAPVPGQGATLEFRQALDRYLFWDVAASGLFYAIIVFWVVMG
jgi:hypothetical protein